MSDEFYRIKRLPPYVIAEVNAMRAAARAAGEDIIDLGMGNPDLPPPQHVIDKLCEVARKPDAHGYSAVQGHSRAAQGAGQLLPAPLRRRCRSRQRSRGDARLEGRARQSRAGDHRAGRRRARAQSELSDPHLRLHHRRRDDPLRCRRRPTSTISKRSSARWPSPCRGRRCWWSTIRRTRPPRWSISPSTSGSSPSRRSTRSGCCPTSPIPNSIIDGKPDALDPAGAGREGRRGRVHLAVQDLFDGGLADRLRGRQPDADRGADPGEILSRLRRLHADPGGRRAPRSTGRRTSSRQNRQLYQQAPRRAGRELRPRRLGHSRRRARRCSPGRRCRRRSRISAASNSPSSC